MFVKVAVVSARVKTTETHANSFIVWAISESVVFSPTLNNNNNNNNIIPIIPTRCILCVNRSCFCGCIYKKRKLKWLKIHDVTWGTVHVSIVEIKE